MATIGLIGAGNIGSQLARLAVAHGYDVAISDSRGPDTLIALVAELGPHARAATVVEAAKAGDIVVVTIPPKHYRTVPAEPLAGKVVIDTNNYYPRRDGQIAELDSESTTTSELLQAHLPTSKVVKAFNHIYAAQLTTDGRPAGTNDRRALVIAGDDLEMYRMALRAVVAAGCSAPVAAIYPQVGVWRSNTTTSFPTAAFDMVRARSSRPGHEQVSGEGGARTPASSQGRLPAGSRKPPELRL